MLPLVNLVVFIAFVVFVHLPALNSQVPDKGGLIILLLVA
uniref:Uncharacterized protein n=1 Tax=Setaria viridis TaxID=4556 RepID=A0A4U6TJP4_SETVI|nr:hypothetical protein SEVIR_8G211533v2 [Setaria viridis]